MKKGTVKKATRAAFAMYRKSIAARLQEWYADGSLGKDVETLARLEAIGLPFSQSTLSVLRRSIGIPDYFARQRALSAAAKRMVATQPI